MPRSRLRFAILVLVAACSSEGPRALTSPPPASAPSRVLVVAGDAQTATVATTLAVPVRIRVLDAQDQPVAGQLVNFVVVAGGGSVFAGSALTTANGEAAEQWTLGTTAGPQRLEARAVDATTGAPIVFATATAEAQPGPAAVLQLRTADTLLLAGQRLRVTAVVDQVTDAYGNALPATGLTVQAPAGFQVAGDSLWADDERAGAPILKVDTATAPLAVTSVLDLRPLRWAVRYSCGGLLQVRGNVSVRLDTLVVTARIDSAFYRGDGHPGFTLASAWALLYYHGAAVRYWADGVVDTLPAYQNSQYLAGQGVGALHFGPEGYGSGAAVLTQTAPRRYAGGSWCVGGWARSGDVVLTE